MTPRQFWQLCKQHDWYYSYSDDHRYWLRGQEEARELDYALQEHPSFRPIWEAWVAWANSSDPDRREPPMPDHEAAITVELNRPDPV